MASSDSLQNKQISATYKDVLQVPNSNSGVDGTIRTVMDGEGTESALQVSTAGVKSTGTLESTGDATIGGTLTIGSTALTSTATELNLLDGIVSIDTDLSSVSASDDTLASAKSVKTYVDAQILTKDNLDEIAEGTTNKHFTASDETKLDGIETGATADQTDAEIRAAVEAATDSNVFTDADHSKLDGIESSADVTDSTNVTAAGALMDSELTDLAGVKGVTISTLQPKPSEGAFVDGDKTKLDGIESGATADQTGAQIKSLYEGESDTNAFTDADHTKLDGIEASATADQTDAEIRAAVDAATDSNVFTDADHSKLDGIASSANNYSHPNHSGEVTSTGDGATVVADDVIDEANLKVDNSPTDDYVLTAKSSAAGGLTWAAASGGGGGGGSGTVNTGSDGCLAYYDGAGTAVNDASTLVWDDVNSRLGIGTTAPSAPLDVVGSGTVAQLESDSSQVLLQFINTGSGNYEGIGSTGNRISVFTNNSERLSIDNSGNVGLGTTAPSYKMHVAGTAYAETYYSLNGYGSNGNNLIDFDSSSNYCVINTNGSERIRIDSSGNVGIGDASPDGKLSIAGVTGTNFGDTTSLGVEVTGAGHNRIKLDTSSTSGHKVAYQLEAGSDTASVELTQGVGALVFDTGGSERMRIDSSGNVGIGTTSIPSAQSLRVAGGDVGFEGQYIYGVHANASIQLGAAQNCRFENNDTTSNMLLSRTGSSGNITLATNSVNRMHIDSAGLVGIGTTAPSYKMHVAGTAYAETYYSLNGYGSNGNNLIDFDSSSNYCVINTNASERLRIGSGGQISQPVETLTTGDTVDIDFSKSNLQTFTLDGTETETTLTGSNYGAGRTVRLMIDMSNDAHSGGITTPSNWNNLGDDPSSIISAGIVVCELTSWTSSDTGVTAVWTDSGGL